MNNIFNTNFLHLVVPVQTTFPKIKNKAFIEFGFVILYLNTAWVNYTYLITEPPLNQVQWKSFTNELIMLGCPLKTNDKN